MPLATHTKMCQFLATIVESANSPVNSAGSAVIVNR